MYNPALIAHALNIVFHFQRKFPISKLYIPLIQIIYEIDYHFNIMKFFRLSTYSQIHFNMTPLLERQKGKPK